MKKKITINLWVEPATSNAGSSQFNDNVDYLLQYINQTQQLPDELESFDLEVLDMEAY